MIGLNRTVGFLAGRSCAINTKQSPGLGRGFLFGRMLGLALLLEGKRDR